MRIPAWRLALTGAVIIVLAVVGIGLATGANAPAAPGTNTTAADQTAAPGATAAPAAPDASGNPARKNAAGRLGKLREGLLAGRLLRAGRHLVHAEVTVTDKDGQLVHLQLDHGTVQSVGGGSLIIAEAGGGTETLSTDDATIVHVGRKDGALKDVTAGDEVFVQSRIDGGSPLAKRILIVPAAAS
jgi:hypothetical protein